ncbi:unnamed protein product [Paramecium sonneborni]|uniref:DNA topoisomerase (ATP-hydrolyzing) n=1 Tax=Paramecium sonneborni TaxID=65129 RepID=A0A8S1LRV9_9CILI|nr:unnamed protein product [Paramecium sonneborni]
MFWTENMAGILPIDVYLNVKKIGINNFKDYAQLYGINGKFAYSFQNKPVLISSSDGQFGWVSFVNSINTIRGGTHVNYIVDQIVEGFLVPIKKKYKEIKNIKYLLVQMDQSQHKERLFILYLIIINKNIKLVLQVDQF